MTLFTGFKCKMQYTLPVWQNIWITMSLPTFVDQLYTLELFLQNERQVAKFHFQDITRFLLLINFKIYNETLYVSVTLLFWVQKPSFSWEIFSPVDFCKFNEQYPEYLLLFFGDLSFILWEQVSLYIIWI